MELYRDGDKMQMKATENESMDQTDKVSLNLKLKFLDVHYI